MLKIMEDIRSENTTLRLRLRAHQALLNQSAMTVRLHIYYFRDAPYKMARGTQNRLFLSLDLIRENKCYISEVRGNL
jgi:hypothetical protein